MLNCYCYIAITETDCVQKKNKNLESLKILSTPLHYILCEEDKALRSQWDDMPTNPSNRVTNQEKQEKIPTDGKLWKNLHYGLLPMESSVLVD